jgi:hypothetical protein
MLTHTVAACRPLSFLRLNRQISLNLKRKDSLLTAGKMPPLKYRIIPNHFSGIADAPHTGRSNTESIPNHHGGIHTARNFMRVAEEFGDKEKISLFAPSALRSLAHLIDPGGAGTAWHGLALARHHYSPIHHFFPLWSFIHCRVL